VQAALLAESAGADGITAHLREDRRHIQDRDIYGLAERIKTRLNLEMAITDEMVGIAIQVRPRFCCLVPERRAELTTEGGLDVVQQLKQVAAVVERLRTHGIDIALFIDPVRPQVAAAAATGAQIVEFNTGGYAQGATANERATSLLGIADAVMQARDSGLIVNAGHGLDFDNVDAIAAVPGLNELNIGHAIISRAVFSGIAEAVREMKRKLEAAKAR
jgi:pyridoxine 5-phosphate synthase